MDDRNNKKILQKKRDHKKIQMFLPPACMNQFHQFPRSHNLYCNRRKLSLRSTASASFSGPAQAHSVRRFHRERAESANYRNRVC